MSHQRNANQTTLRSFLSLLEWQVPRKQVITNVGWRRCGQKETLHTATADVN